DAVIWRGPMVSQLIQQFIKNVAWGALDVLVVDLPPGTGDSQLTLTQTIPLTGAVIVSTPQAIALADAVKGANMFREVKVPVMGLIENMSYFECPHCAHRTNIFSTEGAKQKSLEIDVEYLGALPLEESTRTAGDEGVPIVVREPLGHQAGVFIKMADSLWAKLEKRAGVDRSAFFKNNSKGNNLKTSKTTQGSDEGGFEV
ncbi:MAG: P-loop NTPase, partial [Deltaproteobacteria bacterium]|nr:P-loop NTPase [Deltaproteobacteria bacterium]